MTFEQKKIQIQGTLVARYISSNNEYKTKLRGVLREKLSKKDKVGL